MGSNAPLDDSFSSLALWKNLDKRCDAFESAWKSGERPSIAEYLAEVGPQHRAKLLGQLLKLELDYRRRAGETPSRAAYESALPEYLVVVADVWQEMEDTKSFKNATGDTGDLLPDDAGDGPDAAPEGNHTPAAEEALPATIGRYEVRSLLGEGHFGKVFRAYDTELNREVAIKLQRRRKSSDDKLFRKESQILARLDHPNIVPAYDAGQLPEGQRYVVSKLVGGGDLKDWMDKGPLTFAQIAELLATIAEALHYAHRHQLTHRDVKPANILIDSSGTPIVADFGLALTEEDFDDASLGQGGTVAYMSPEQARGEGHRVDGRSDIFSLGVVMYEMCTGHRPFRGSQVRDQIKTLDPRPPRMLKDTIPKELQRICLKALSKRATDRFNTALDMAEALRQFKPLPSDAIGSQRPRTKIVPKGLRAFDGHDADFFLDLLPGPYDADGLPESVRFWKNRVEELDPDETFRVGLIYGPSGCGKSSLVKAGLLPRLAGEIIPVYIEATSDNTEHRLLRALRKHVPFLDEDLELTETLAVLRHGPPDRTRGKKVLIILDQFEQWLHAGKINQDCELVTALRQCDGGHVQCLLMVRDDFWLAISRLMQEIEVPDLKGHNSRLVDLFGPRHARSVLAKFGQAFGALPEDSSSFTPEQEQFLDRAIAELAEEDKIICVRLALFAEMLKRKPWRPATLTGGEAGVAEAFLEETFSAGTASPTHRRHEEAVRRVLRELLPESCANIKGVMRSCKELRSASGYAHREKDFAELIRILDSELRLITPTDPAGQDITESAPLDPSQRYYQLTHDYLVPSLREWLTRKQKETRRGRAELQLEDRAELWTRKPENQQLPTAWEYLNTVALTEPGRWTAPQQRMMRAATRYYSTRVALLVVLIIVLAWGARGAYSGIQSAALVKRLATAEASKVLDTVDELRGYMPWVRKDLQDLARREPETRDERTQQLHARLALVATDDTQVAALVESLLTAPPKYVGVISNALEPYDSRISGELWSEFQAENNPADRRFRAGMSLAMHATDAEQWREDDYRFLAEQLVSSNPEHQPIFRENFQRISDECLLCWEDLFKNAESIGAANALAEFAGEDQERIAELLAVANPQQYAILFPLFGENPSEAAKRTLAEIAAQLPRDDLPSEDRVLFGQRRAGAGITLLRLDERESVLPTFNMTDDPEALTQFIHRCRDRGVRTEELLELLAMVTPGMIDGPAGDTSRSRYALLLALGEYSLDEIPASRRDQLLADLGDWYTNDPSSSVHGASGWLLRQWGQDEIVQKVDQTPVPYSPDREWFTLAITVKSPRREYASPSPEAASESTKSAQEDSLGDSGGGNTTANGTSDSAESEGSATDAAEAEEGQADRSENEPSNAADAAADDTGDNQQETQPEYVPQTLYLTFIVFQPGEYQIGSIGDEPELRPDEGRHTVRLTRPFALLDREITFAELIAFDAQFFESMMRHPQVQAEPMDAGSTPIWYEAVSFCRWLTEQAGFSEEDQSYPAPDDYLEEKEHPREPNPEANWAPRNWPMHLDRRGFRLPTEAEWEVACRIGTRTMYRQGADVGLLQHYAWFLENSRKHVHPPKRRRPALGGLFDMHGNLFEWCHDWYGSYATETVEDETGPKVGLNRAGRGGGWNYVAADCRSSFRNNYAPTSRRGDLGFRLALFPSSLDAECKEERAEAVDSSQAEPDGS